jgi:hypothetical protein
MVKWWNFRFVFLSWVQKSVQGQLLVTEVATRSPQTRLVHENRIRPRPSTAFLYSPIKKLLKISISLLVTNRKLSCNTLQTTGHIEEFGSSGKAGRTNVRRSSAAV